MNKGVDFEFIKAVDGATLSDEYLARICDFEELTTKRPHLLRKGVYGCLLSHYSVYQRIVAENLPYALVMEDDVEISAGLKEVLKALEPVIKKNEAVLLFSQNSYMLTTLSEQNADILLEKYRVSYPIQSWALGSAAGYVITREAAQGLIDLVLPIRYAADGWPFFYYYRAIHSLRCVTPFLLKQLVLRVILIT
jgi:glycosyl transferase family 25